MLKVDDPAVLDFDQHGTLGAGLPRMTTLEIAGINDVRLFPQHGMGVDMAQRPIIIPMIGELFGRARGVTGMMTFAADTCRMQYADVEQGLGRCGILARGWSCA